MAKTGIWMKYNADADGLMLEDAPMPMNAKNVVESHDEKFDGRNVLAIALGIIDSHKQEWS